MNSDVDTIYIKVIEKKEICTFTVHGFFIEVVFIPKQLIQWPDVYFYISTLN